MPAAVYTGDGQIAVQAVPVPRPAAGEALVEVSHCGICGTDLHLVLEQYARPGSVLGHEWSGTVVGVGADADVALVGTRVVANPTPGCGECRACLRGRPSVCLRRPPPDHLDFRGAFSQFVIVDSARLLPIPSGAARPRGRAHRTDRDRDAHGQPLGRAARATACSSPAAARSACSRWRCSAPAASTTSRSWNRRRRGERARRTSAPASSRPTTCRARRWVGRSRRRTRSRSSAPGTRARRRRRSTSSTTPARSCSSAPGTSCRASTTTGRSCSS